MHIRGVEVQLHSSLTSVLGGVECLASCPICFTLGDSFHYPQNRTLTFIVCLVTLNVQWGMLQRMNATMNVEEYYRPT
jgi:hypothetical protein